MIWILITSALLYLRIPSLLQEPAEGEEPSAKKKRGPGRPKRVDGEEVVSDLAMSQGGPADAWSTANTIRNGIAQSTGENDSDTEDEDVGSDEPRWPAQKTDLNVTSSIVVVDASVSASPPSTSTLSDVNKAPLPPINVGAIFAAGRRAG